MRVFLGYMVKVSRMKRICRVKYTIILSVKNWCVSRYELHVIRILRADMKINKKAVVVIILTRTRFVWLWAHR